MKKTTIQSERNPLFTITITLASCLCLLGGIPHANAGEILNADFSKGTVEESGWTPKGDWSIKDYGAAKPGLANSPGPVAVFAAGGKTVGTLTKKFDTASNPSSLKLTFDAGFGWGAKTHVQSFQVMLLDADGNGYVFDVHRANATWGAQWAVVSDYGYNEPLHWAPAAVDTTQDSVMAGGGLRAFTITRDAGGNWTFDGKGWTGGPLKFTDTTTSSFSQVVLRGFPNTDEIVFGKVKLEAGK
ncbi:MAG: hypothetical protein WC003_08400 [Terrimicrobiaceae bacterium]